LDGLVALTSFFEQKPLWIFFMLSRALKLLRTFHQLNQNELAKILGISNSYLSEIESGNKKPSLELLNKYSLAFKVPVSSILLFSEKLEEKKGSKILREKAADKILRILEWISERETLANDH
jgi:transcriptional regulator with XRE-family HTH domain